MLAASGGEIGQGGGQALPPELRPAPSAPDDLRNLEETARFFGVSVPTVRGWIAQDVNPCPVYQRGTNGVGYSLSLTAVAAWRRDVMAADQAEAERKAAQEAQLRLDLLGDGALSGKLDAAGAGPLSPRARGEAIQAELAATRLAQMRRELVEADQVQLALAGAFGRIGAYVRSLPERIERELGLADRDRVIIAGVVDEILHTVADELEGLKAESAGNAAN